jgi:heme/copper-type cytochrome/quinol oxidase subunit 2
MYMCVCVCVCVCVYVYMYVYVYVCVCVCVYTRSRKPTSRMNSWGRNLKGTIIATVAKTSPAMMSEEPSISPATDFGKSVP